VTGVERHHSFIKDALKSMQGEWSQRMIVLAFEHLDKLIKVQGHTKDQATAVGSHLWSEVQ
jgi:hypothetical protein